jgi:hypothetical protein
MLRAISALREWLELRARLREEHQFHLDQAAADFRDLGLSRREARRSARARFGGRRNLTIALRELGGDLPGLGRLLHAHRVLASAWLQPAVLLTATALIFGLSPSPREVVEGVIVRIRNVDDPGAVSLSVQGRSPWSGGGITPSEFAALRSMTTVTDVGRYRGLYARARAAYGASLPAIQSEARANTGNPNFVVTSISHHTEIAMDPAQSVWVIGALYGVFFLFGYARQFRTPRWLLWRWLFYGLGVVSLHAAASLTVWTFAVQLWNRRQFTLEAGGLSFALLFLAFLGIAAMQCRYWWSDLRQRCPICLDGLLLPLIEGTDDRVLLSPATTESVCAHGHGVLVEGRWSRAFRPQESPLQAVVHF